MIRSKQVFPLPGEDDGVRVLVMRFIPRTFVEEKKQAEADGQEFAYPWDIWLPGLAPSPPLLNKFRNKEEHFYFNDFVPKYFEEISSSQGIFLLRGVTTTALTQNVTLLCCEQNETYCHRRLVKDVVLDMMQHSKFDIGAVWTTVDVEAIIAEHAETYTKRYTGDDKPVNLSHTVRADNAPLAPHEVL